MCNFCTFGGLKSRGYSLEIPAKLGNRLVSTNSSPS